eukprot:15480040-Alexandrium_andersonii.AAC.1
MPGRRCRLVAARGTFLDSGLLTRGYPKPFVSRFKTGPTMLSATPRSAAGGRAATAGGKRATALAALRPTQGLLACR